MRAALYARVSTSDQTVEPQLHELRRYAEARGLEVVREDTDDGVSGLKASRPALDALLAACFRREVDVVAVTKLDRLGRSLHHLLTVLGELEALGIDFVSLDDGIDTRTPAGRLFMQMRGAFAEYERALIVERTKAGLEAARRRGKTLGRPPALDARDLRRLRRMRTSGRSIRDVARTLDVSPTTVMRAVALSSQERARSAT